MFYSCDAIISSNPFFMEITFLLAVLPLFLSLSLSLIYIYIYIYHFLSFFLGFGVVYLAALGF